MGSDTESFARPKAGVDMIMVLGCYKLWRIQTEGMIASLSDDNAENRPGPRVWAFRTGLTYPRDIHIGLTLGRDSISITAFPLNGNATPPFLQSVVSMASSEDDEDLKLAIALSLQDPNSKGAGKTVLDAISLDDESETENGPTRAATNAEVSNDSLAPKIGLGVLGLDRKQMEQERLGRKRKATSISPPPARKIARGKSGSASVLAKETTKEGSLFPLGTVKKTWAFGHERTADDVKLEEVLQKHTLNLAVLSSFQWDIDWLLEKIDIKSTFITLVMQAKDQATEQQYRRETAAMPNLRLCFPSMEGQINCMHSKLMLLSHPNHLRVAVPTANLVPYDWGETGIVRAAQFKAQSFCSF